MNKYSYFFLFFYKKFLFFSYFLGKKFLFSYFFDNSYYLTAWSMCLSICLSLFHFLAHLIYQMCYCYQKLDFHQKIGLKCTNRPQMYRYCSLIGSDSEFCTFEAKIRPQMYRIGLKCTELASNVQNFHTFEAEIIYFLM